ncbi:MAG: hypothetical protein DI568_08335 [Sphingomonas sp.]|nr:MAG: hypothetical protein DI568_08335 [Sphingomonas sp.]
MKGDFSRDSFDPHMAYQRILHQQGRLTLDAEFNEQTAVLLHLLRTTTCDLIGPYGGPVDDAGFEIRLTQDGTLVIGAGRYYVGGLLVQNDQPAPYQVQPFYRPMPDDGPLASGGDAPSRVTLLYLEVFERVVTSLIDPAIADPALDGIETALRGQVVWQVRAIETAFVMDEVLEDPDAASQQAMVILTALDDRPSAMAARAAPSDGFGDGITAGYTGMENGLFRIEVHRGGVAGEAQFKWSRTNAGVVAPWLGLDGDHLVIADAGRLEGRRVIELTTADRELDGREGELIEIAPAGQNRFTVAAGDISAVRALWDSGLDRPFARSWDRVSAGRGDAPGLTDIEEGTPDRWLWLDLADGIQIAFSPGGVYRVGDYWQIPVRAGTGAILWPGVIGAQGRWIPDARVPAGVRRWRAPLALHGLSAGQPILQDCRRLFPPR